MKNHCQAQSQPATDLLAIAGRFPALQVDPEILFLDNASTTQKPDTVIAAIESFYKSDCANAGRALYPSSLRAAQCIEQTRAQIADFIGAECAEVAFTSGATESLNAVVWSWALANLQDGDEIMLCLKDHSSAILPWQNIEKVLAGSGKRILLKTFQIHPVGDYDLRSIKETVCEKTRLIALSHIHHVFGLDMEIGEIRRIIGKNVLISLDASQSIAHTRVDAGELDVDFISFSGHKAFAGNGIGVLYARKQRHAEMIHYRCGGQTLPTMSPISAEARAAFIDKVEAGTANLPSIASMSAALAFIKEVGLENIVRHNSALTSMLVEKLKALPGIIFAPGPVPCGCPGGFGILSFRFEHVSSFDLAAALANEKIYVRSGHHCRLDSSEEEDYIRVSMQIYNKPEDIEILVRTLENLVA